MISTTAFNNAMEEINQSYSRMTDRVTSLEQQVELLKAAKEEAPKPKTTKA